MWPNYNCPFKFYSHWDQMSTVKNNSWSRSMLPQNFSEPLKCCPYSQFIFLLCSWVVKARGPGETGSQATLQHENMLGQNSHSWSLPIWLAEGSGCQWFTDTPWLVSPHHSCSQPPGRLACPSFPICPWIPSSCGLSFILICCPKWSLRCSGLDPLPPAWSKVFAFTF